MSTEDQRQRWKAHWQEFHQLSSAWQERGYSGPAPTYPELPDDLIGMTCGAKTRAGKPCKQKTIYSNGRCKFHGGLATGPTTEAGKEQCRINGLKGGRPRKAGVVLKDVRVSEVIETEVLEPQEHPKVEPDCKVSARVTRAQALISSAAKTEVMEADKTIVSEEFNGVVLGRVVTTELQDCVRPESIPEKPKSWDSRKVMVWGMCERCTMFASNGACLAVAKGRISSMPTGDDCEAFLAF